MMLTTLMSVDEGSGPLSLRISADVESTEDEWVVGEVAAIDDEGKPYRLDKRQAQRAGDYLADEAARGETVLRLTHARPAGGAP